MIVLFPLVFLALLAVIGGGSIIKGTAKVLFIFFTIVVLAGIINGN